jgi:hypothetical protein
MAGIGVDPQAASVDSATTPTITRGPGRGLVMVRQRIDPPLPSIRFEPHGGARTIASVRTNTFVTNLFVANMFVRVEA